MTRFVRVLFGLAALAALAAAGCGDTKPPLANQPPETFITSSVPRDSSRVAHRVQILWRGADLDGTTAYSEYFLRTYARSITRIDQIDMTPPVASDPGWTRVNGSTITLDVPADTLRADPRGDIGAGEFDRWSTFFVRAVDNDGDADPTPDARTFFAFTTAPVLDLVAPVVATGVATVPRNVVLNWNGEDRVSPAFDLEDPRASRWVLLPATLDAGMQPIGFPAALYDLPETAWSPWKGWADPDSSGREAVLRNVVSPGGSGTFVFAVQARDTGGAVTPKFERTNAAANNYAVLRADGTLPVGPRITLRAAEDSSYVWTFDGAGAAAQTLSTAQDTLTLSWSPPAAGHYGARARETRWGWDIANPSDDLQWNGWNTARTAGPFALTPGSHRFYLQARDHIGQVTQGLLEVSRTTGKPARQR